MRTPLPAAACVISFIDAINHGDVERLAALMDETHCLQVLDEPPVKGRTANIEAWHGYATAFPDYVIYPHEFASRDAEVAVVGHTTGSHLGLPDEEERELTVIWRATVAEGRLTLWQILEDTPSRRQEFGLPAR